jgi:hypothetical protein
MAIKINNITVINDNIRITADEVTGTTDLSFGGGSTSSRPGSPVVGDIRYNITVSKIEVYSGTGWRFLENLIEPAGTVGLFAGGFPSNSTIQQIDLNASFGNAEFFGELSIGRSYLGAASNSTTAIFAGGNSPTLANFGTIDYVTVASGGNAEFFGFLSQYRHAISGSSNSIYALFGGGFSPGWTSRIDRVNITSAGNATNFGSMSLVRSYYGTCSSPTRGYFGGGWYPGNSARNEIDSLAFTSGGTASDFGDLTVSRIGLAGASNPLRGLFAGGTSAGNFDLGSGRNEIDYITFESSGASTDFGDLTAARTYVVGASNPTHGYFAGGRLTSPTGRPATNIIDRVAFESNANATDFGDLDTGRYNHTGTSNSHGGLDIDPGYTPTSLTGDIAIFAGGEIDNYLEAIDYMAIATGGSTSPFGELTIGRKYLASAASSTRGLITGGYSPTLTNHQIIDYVTIASTGNAQFFGRSGVTPGTTARHGLAGLNSDTRALFGGGNNPSIVSNIDYVTIATLGNTSNFGSLTLNRTYLAAASNGTRGVFAGGFYSPGPSVRNEIDYVTIATTGNAADFGDLTVSRAWLAAAGNYSRGLFAGGTSAPDTNRTSSRNEIDMITFSALGASSDFGDLTAERSYLDGTSSSTEAIFSGGTRAPGTQNTTIEKVVFDTKGNTSSFGTLSRANRHHTSTSNANGGLGTIPPSAGVDLTTSGTAVFAGGFNPNDTLQYLNLNSASNAVKFGELSIGRSYLGSHSNTTTAIFAGGNSPTLANFGNIDYVTLATAGNSEFFGSLYQAGHALSGTGDSTYAIFGGRFNPGWSSVIDRVTITSTGNAVNFGGMSLVRTYYGTCASPTRGYFGGGWYPGNSARNEIDSLAFTSGGTATDFGDLTVSRIGLTGASNPLRGLFAGGTSAGDTNLSSGRNEIDYITFESSGASTDFGDLIQSRTYLAGVSNPTHGYFAGGRITSPGAPAVNTIDRVAFVSNANASDFGDLNSTRYLHTGTSNSHGGLDIDPGYTSTTLTGDIAIFAGGESDNYLEAIDYMAIATGGSTSPFGELTSGRKYLASAASSTRGLIAGGYSPTNAHHQIIDYITIASTGNAQFFGRSGISASTVARHGLAGLNSDTRALFGGGSSPGIRSEIDYVTIATLGNTSNFGSLTLARTYLAAASSGTRGVFAGGFYPGPSVRNEIDYVTIATTGNAIDFGDLTVSRAWLAGAGNYSRGLFAGGTSAPDTNRTSSRNEIDMITFSSIGASSDFGDLTAERSYLDGTSSSTEAIFSGGTRAPGTQVTTIEKVEFQTKSNTTSFGTLSRANRHHTSTSNANGGLGTIPPSAGLDLTTSGIAVFAGGFNPNDTLQYLNLNSASNAVNFGELSIGRSYLGSHSNTTTAIFAGGNSPTLANFSNIDYVTLATAGNSEFFGTLYQAGHALSGAGNDTYAIFGGRFNPGWSSVIDRVTMASTGNAANFGSMSLVRTYYGTCASPTRGYFGGGWYPGNSARNEIDSLSFTSGGTATDFGDLTVSRIGLAGASNPLRGLFAGGTSAGNFDLASGRNEIDYITFESSGASTDFGDLIQSRTHLAGASNPTHGYFAGGRITSPGRPAVNTIDRVAFESNSNASDFGDLTSTRYLHTGTSNSHGGLDIDPGYTSTTLTGNIAIFAGGESDNYLEAIDYMAIAASSTTSSFGELTVGRKYLASAASSTRGLITGGYSPTLTNHQTIDYVTIASTGNAQFFGRSGVTPGTTARHGLAGLNSPTRALFGGGNNPGIVSNIDYVTIATLGNTSNFGSLTLNRTYLAAASSGTRGVFAGGFYSPGPSVRNEIDYVTIATTGNAIDFGDLTVSRAWLAAAGNYSRGLFAGGTSAPDTNRTSSRNEIDMITFSALGASSDFGDLTAERSYLDGTSSSTEAIFSGGTRAPGTQFTSIDKVDFQSKANATFFGTLSRANRHHTSTSNANGGLGVVPPSAGVDLTTSGTAVFAGGFNPNDEMQYLNLNSAANAVKFGELSIGRSYLGAHSNTTTAIFAGGNSPTLANFGNIDYVTLATAGNSEFFGSLYQAGHALSGTGDSTYAIFGGRFTPGWSSVIDRVTMASTGNAANFGGMSLVRTYYGTCASPTRGYFGGGWYPGNSARNEIDSLAFASGGTATDFGDLTVSRIGLAGASNTLRGLFAGGTSAGDTNLSSGRNEIDMITFSSVGASSDFGDLTQSRTYLASASSPTQGFFAGGRITSPGAPAVNTIDKVDFQSKSNATDHGDLTSTRYLHAGTSNSHGGLNLPVSVPTVDISTSGTAVFAGGFNPNDTMQYLNLNSASNAVNFGELSIGRSYLGAHSNTTTAIFAGGNSPTLANFGNIDYVTLATAGNSEFFGSLYQAGHALSGAGNDTYAIFGGRFNPSWSSVIDRVTMTSAGNAVNFGGMSLVRTYYGTCSSPTRGYFGGGWYPGNSARNEIDSLAFTSGGTATDFGDLTVSRTGLAGASNPLRGLFAGGTSAGNFDLASGRNEIDYITFESSGASTDFGDLIQSRTYLAGASNPTHGYFAGGRITSPGAPAVNTIDRVAFESNANASDFGDLTSTRYLHAGTSNSHGGLDIDPGYSSTTLTGDIAIFAGGESDNYLEAIDYMAIATGGSTSPFGELTIGRKYLASAASSTRGLITGGYSPTLTNHRTIDYVTIASTGNSQFFGLSGVTPGTTARHGLAGLNSDTRALFGGGLNPGFASNIDYVTIATLGNTSNFGSLTLQRTYLAAASSGTRGVFAGGYYATPSPTARNEIDYVTIATTGNAADFGDLTVSRSWLAGAGNYSRGLFAGGTSAGDTNRTSSRNEIDMITFSALGASSDFGDLTAERSYLDGTSSSTEAIFSGGTRAPGTQTTTIEKVAFNTKANTSSFGTLSRANRHHTSTSNANGGLGVVPPSSGVDLTTSGTAVFVGGFNPNDTMQYLNLNSASNAVKFGELSIGRSYLGSHSNTTTAIFAGGNSPTLANFGNIDYTTLATAGNSEFFGNLYQAGHALSGTGDSTYAIFGGRFTPGWSSVIDRVTMASTGNAANFGSMSLVRTYYGTCASPTRGYFGGGWYPGNSARNEIDSLSFTSGGTATDFGDLTVSRIGLAGASNTLRGLFAGGTSAGDTNLSSGRNEIDMITFSSVGASSDFGDLTQSRTYLAGVSSPTQGFFAGGRITSPGAPAVNTIDKVDFQSKSNASDFGDLNSTRYLHTGTSNSHGGLDLEVSVPTVDLSTSGTAVFAGGFNPNDTLQYLNLNSASNAVNFGELSIGRSYLGSHSNTTTAIFAGGNSPTLANFRNIDYVTLATAGNSEFFGNLYQAGHALSGTGNDTYAIFGGRFNPSWSSVIDRVTMTSAGNAVNFGSMSLVRTYYGTCASPTRGYFGGGWYPGNSARNEIDSLAFASGGTATDFGDLTVSRIGLAGASNPLRGLFAGGTSAGNFDLASGRNEIDYITFESSGASTDFGDLIQSRTHLAGASNPTHGYFAGGRITSPGRPAVNTIDRVAFESNSNASDFGDLTSTRYLHTGTSNSHGGLDIDPGYSSTTLTGDIAIFAGGESDNYLEAIDYMAIATGGSTGGFGELTIGRKYAASAASSTRGLITGGYSPTLTNHRTIDYVTIASTGNAQFFGLSGVTPGTTARHGLAGLNSPTRALFGGGNNPGIVSNIDYVTIATLGNTSNFGSLTLNRTYLAAASSGTRGVFAGGFYSPGPSVRNEIDYVTIATTGNAADFGDLTVSRAWLAGASNVIRGLFAGGTSAPDTNRTSSRNEIDYITFESIGASTDFGDLTAERSYLDGTSSSTEAIFSGGTRAPGTQVTTIEKVSFENKGNTTSYGTLSRANRHHTSTSNANGGLGVDPGYTPSTLTGDIGLFAGGDNNNADIQRLNISSSGNTTNFGELTIGRSQLAAGASSTRSVFAGGNSPTLGNHGTIDYVTTASTGNAQFFGFLSQYRYALSGSSNSTYALFGGGFAPGWTSRIDRTTIATTGNSSNFGSMSLVRSYYGTCASPTRGYFGGGWYPGNSARNEIDSLAFASGGTATDFGDLTVSRIGLTGASNRLRGLFAGGTSAGDTNRNSGRNEIDYITFDSSGASTDFGDLTQARMYLEGTSNSFTAVFAGGNRPSPSNTTTQMDSVNFVTQGNASTFGSLIQSYRLFGATSNSHGGLDIDPNYGSSSLSGDIGIFAGGDNNNASIQYLEISSTGNTNLFGELTIGRSQLAAGASSTRSVFAGGNSPTLGTHGTIDYSTIASTGNAQFFGFLSQYRYALSGNSNSTYALFGGGFAPGWTSRIDRTTIATTGNSSNFGSMSLVRSYYGTCASPTRGYFGGGWYPGNSARNEIDSLAFTSGGGASDFGDLTVSRIGLTGASSSTRGLFAGGTSAGDTNRNSGRNEIDYITFSSSGNATDFGNLTQARMYLEGTSSPTRAVFAGGNRPSPSNTTTQIDYVTIASTGNATSFGSLVRSYRLFGATSNSHGGI